MYKERIVKNDTYSIKIGAWTQQTAMKKIVCSLPPYCQIIILWPGMFLLKIIL